MGGRGKKEVRLIMFTILNFQSPPRLNRLYNCPKSYQIKPTPSQSSVTSRTVVHKIVGKEGKNASANMMPKMADIKNYRKTENLGGKSNQTQTTRQEKINSYTNTKCIQKPLLLLFA